MPIKGSDSPLTQSTPQDQVCPKCGAETEPIEIAVDGLSMQELQLCPGCYLVIWSDQDGMHVRQGVPMKRVPDSKNSSDPVWMGGEPKEC